MKKLSIVLFFLFNFTCLLAQDAVMVELRDLFYKSTIKESYIQEVNEYMDAHEEQPPFSSYRAMTLFMKSKYVSNPYKKFSFFKKGKVKMESAVNAHFEDVETRFLRLMVQVELPNFLSYNKNIKSDQKFILDNYSKISDKDLRNRIILFFKEHELLTNEEISQL